MTYIIVYYIYAYIAPRSLRKARRVLTVMHHNFNNSAYLQECRLLCQKAYRILGSEVEHATRLHMIYIVDVRRQAGLGPSRATCTLDRRSR